MAAAILSVFSAALNKDGRFSSSSPLSSVATLKCHFQCFFLQFICLTFHLSTLHLPLTRPPHPTSSILLPRFCLLGDFPVGVLPSAPQYSHVNQRVTVCLMLMAARCLVHHLFGVTVHLDDSLRVLERRKTMRREHANRCLIITSAGKTQ